MTTLPHPSINDIELAHVLAALGDETRLAMISLLARDGQEEMTCSQFLHLGSKTGLSYHLAKLREAGLVNVRPDGTRRMISLRRADLDRRFPGVLDSVITCQTDTPNSAEE